MTETIDVLIVDDHAVVREGLRAFLELQDGIRVVGEAGDGEQALAQAAALAPDVILMDLVMPGTDGIAAMRALRARGDDARVIVLTSFLDDDRLLPAMRAGAAGYLLKDVEPGELARAVRRACAGEALIDPTVAARLLSALSDGDPGRPGAGDQGPGGAGAAGGAVIGAGQDLTPREREVLALIAQGRSNKRIARELEIAEKTVKAHVGRVLAKLGVPDRTSAALLAVREGLVSGS